MNNSLSSSIERWFIPFDILDVICLFLVLLIVIVFLIVIIFDQTCHTIPMILVANSCLAELMFTGDIFWMAVVTLQNDLERRTDIDSLCVIRGYLSYVTCCAQNYSYLLQALYRYLRVVYPTHLFCRTRHVQFGLIILSWISSFVYALPHLFSGNILYHEDDQICQMPLQFTFITIYNILYVYIIPMNGIIWIYFRLFRYVREMNDHVTPVNTLIRARRELTMVHRIVLLLAILLALGFPYTIFIFIGFFTRPPRYHFRISYIFIDISLLLIIITIFKFTDPLRTALIKRIKRRTNIVTTIRL